MVKLQEKYGSVPFVWWIEIGLTFANILFQLVGIFHANKTKKEIDGTEGYSPIPSGVAEVGTSA